MEYYGEKRANQIPVTAILGGQWLSLYHKYLSSLDLKVHLAAEFSHLGIKDRDQSAWIGSIMYARQTGQQYSKFLS